jgi:hypothetical protein
VTVDETLHDVACPNPGCNQYGIAKPLPAVRTDDGLLLTQTARCGDCKTPVRPVTGGTCC